LADLQGPKIRTHKFKDGQVQLIRGETFILDAALGKKEGTQGKNDQQDCFWELIYSGENADKHGGISLQ